MLARNIDIVKIKQGNIISAAAEEDNCNRIEQMEGGGGGRIQIFKYIENKPAEKEVDIMRADEKIIAGREDTVKQRSAALIKDAEERDNIRRGAEGWRLGRIESEMREGRRD